LLQNRFADTINVKDFGAKGDGTTDDTAAIQAAINAQINGGIVFFPNGTYKISATISKPQSFVGPSLIGESYNSTIFNYSSISSNSSCIYLQGGSGSIADIIIQNIKFIGNSTSRGIEIDGQDGVLIKSCYFSNNSIGIYFNNKTTSSFTEYCVADYCNFDSNCITAINYNVVSGNNSFHGSGIRNCTINSSGSPAIVIGNGALPYNSPLSTQIWGTLSSAYLIQNNNTSYLNCNFYGNITIEPSNSSQIILCSGSTSNRTFFTGTIESINQNWKRGTLAICQQFTGNSDGSYQAIIAPYSVSTANVVNNSAINFVPVIPTGDTSAGINSGYLLNITLIGTNYRYTYLAIYNAALGAGGSNTITVLATQQTFNVSGWGTATFSINSSQQLVVTNVSAGFNVTAIVGITQIGGATLN
jgi:hypothetical protein